MKRIGVALTFVVGSMCLVALSVGRAQDPGGGVLKNPFAEPATPGSSPTRQAPTSALQLFGNPTVPSANPLPDGNPLHASYQAVLDRLKPNPNLAMNRDIEIKPEVGPWVIQVIYYQGPEGPQMAREMVAYLRKEYKLHAYVFNFGIEEKQKEYERVQRAYQKAVEKMRELQETFKDDVCFQRVKVPHILVQEQVAVVVGGYRDESSARRALDDMRKLKPPDEKKVKLQVRYGGERDDKDLKNFKLDNGEAMFANPFRTAWVAANPASKRERQADNFAGDLDLLRRLNRGEPFSLLQAKKPFTLVIKNFAVTTLIHGRDEKPNVLETAKSSREDFAAQNAHSLAEVLRKGKIDAYVLHTNYSSFVTVGQYERLDDPALISMQNFLAERLKLDPRIGLLPRPVPMEVPGVRTAAARSN